MAEGVYKIKTMLDTSNVTVGFSVIKQEAGTAAKEVKTSLEGVKASANGLGAAVVGGLGQSNDSVARLNGLFKDANGVIRNTQGQFATLGDVASTELDGVTDDAKKLIDEIKTLGQLKALDFGLDRNSKEFSAGLIKASQYRSELKQQEKTLKALIPTLDRTTDEYSQAAAQLGTVKTALVGVNEKLDRFQQIGSGFKNVGGALSLGVTAPLLAAGTAAVKLASDAGEIQSKFATVFKGNTADAEAFAEALGRNVGRAQTDLKSYLATLQDTFVPLGFARDQAAELSKELVALAVDVASFNNEADSETLASFQSALVGNTETVRKYGIVITEATTTQKALELGLANTKNEISEQDKVYARYVQILEGTSDAQGDAERTAGSAANSFKAFKAALSDAGVELGENLLPTLTKALQGVTDLVRGFSELDEGTQDLIIQGALLAGALGPIVLGLGNVLTTVSSVTVALAASGLGWAGLGAKIAPFLGPAGLLLGVAVAGATVNAYLAENNRIVLDQVDAYDKAVTQLGNYQRGLEVTSEAERTAAINSLETQKQRIEKVIDLNQAFVDSLLAQNDELLAAPAITQLFKLGDLQTLRTNSTAIEKTQAQIDTLRATIKNIDTDISRVSTLEIGSLEDGGISLSQKKEDLRLAREEFESAQTEEARNAANERVGIIEGEIAAIEKLYKKDTSGARSSGSSSSFAGKRTSQDVFDDLAIEGTFANKKAVALGTPEAALDAAQTRQGLLRSVLDELIRLGASDVEIANVVSRITAIEEEIRRLTPVNILQGATPSVSVSTARSVPLPEPSVSLKDKVALFGGEYDASTGTYKAKVEAEVFVTEAKPLEIPAPIVELREPINIFGGRFDAKTGIYSPLIEATATVKEPVKILGMVYDPSTGYTTEIKATVSVAPLKTLELPTPLVEFTPQYFNDKNAEAIAAERNRQTIDSANFAKDVDKEQDDAAAEAAETTRQSADDFANTIVGAAGQVGDVLLGALSGNLSAGGIVSGLGGAAASIVGAINPLAGAITGVATSFLGGAIDFFTGGNKDEEEKRKRDSEKSRSVPAINITAQVNQTNNYTGVPSDPRTVATNEQQTRFLISEVLTQLKYPQVLEKVGLA